jgi:hypothetical protein
MSKKKSTSVKLADVRVRTRTQQGAPKTKLARLEAMLRRPDGATIQQIGKSLDWQLHSVRGAMSGNLKKKQGLTITHEKADDGRRIYRIA